MAKTLDDNWADWEGHVFGFGYGTGEAHTIPALKAFLAACPEQGGYDYRDLEKALGPVATWLLINTLAHADVLEYGSSPRFAWLTDRGRALKAFVDSKSTEELTALACRGSDYTPCYPDACNCGPNGYEEGRKCVNPFWS